MAIPICAERVSSSVVHICAVALEPQPEDAWHMAFAPAYPVALLYEMAPVVEVGPVPQYFVAPTE
jgi:hypothetical protein